MRNTYLLLGLTLAFSSLVTYVAIAAGAPYLGFFPTLIGFFGLLFVVQRLANSAWGLLAVFAFTGFLGYTLGPVLSMYLKLPNGPQLVGQALGLTSVAFVGLSLYALTTRKDFSFLSGFLVDRLLRADGRDSAEPLHRHLRTVARDLGRHRAVRVRGDLVRDESRDQRRRDELHPRHRRPLRVDLQPVHELAAPAGRRAATTDRAVTRSSLW